MTTQKGVENTRATPETRISRPRLAPLLAHPFACEADLDACLTTAVVFVFIGSPVPLCSPAILSGHSWGISFPCEQMVSCRS